MTTKLDFRYRSLTPDDTRAMRLGEHYRKVSNLISAVMDNTCLSITEKGEQIELIVNSPPPAPFDLDYAYGAQNLARVRGDTEVVELWQAEIDALKARGDK